MAGISISAERDVAAPAEAVYGILADYREHHPRILPPAFTGFTVESGGSGEGTVIRFEVKSGGRAQSFHQRVSEPEPGRVLRESALDGDLATTFTVTPTGDDRSHVRIETTWSTGGMRGWIERLVAPRLLRPIYVDELERLDQYARTRVIT